jgi:hypothetical protein
MKRYLTLTLILTLLALGIGCAGAATPAARINDSVQGSSAPAPAAPPVAASEAYDSSADGTVANQRKSAGGSGGVPSQAQDQDETRMIVYTGSVSLQVNDTTETVNKITELLKGVNGYISSKSLAAYGKDKQRGTIAIRIPAASLESTITQIKALGVKVLNETQASDDVTAEYTDLDARRKNLEVYEVELQKLLDTVRERTGKAEDILAVYNQLTEVRGQIESIKGRQRYLENTSTLATYTIELVPVEEVVVQGTPGWNPGNVAGSALDDLISTMQGLANVAIYLALYVLPVLLIILIPIVLFVLIVRTVLRRRMPKKPVVAA